MPCRFNVARLIGWTVASGKAACAKGEDFIFAMMIQQPFGHHATAAIASAKNENFQH